jgi:hypothetical protein
MTGKTEGDEQYTLTLDRMSNDLVDVLRELLPDRATAPKVLLVGHSMVRCSRSPFKLFNARQGGPVVVEAVAKVQAGVADVLGVAVLDVVEGTETEHGPESLLKSAQALQETPCITCTPIWPLSPLASTTSHKLWRGCAFLATACFF